LAAREPLRLSLCVYLFVLLRVRVGLLSDIVLLHCAVRVVDHPLDSGGVVVRLNDPPPGVGIGLGALALTRLDAHGA
jgi:hypothetical protein